MTHLPGGNRLRHVFIGISAAVLLAGCTGEDDMQPTMTLAEANKRVDRYIANAVEQIPGKTRLVERTRREDAECLEGLPSELTGRRQAEREYEIAGISADRIPSYFDLLKKWWSENGFDVIDNNPGYEFLSVENKSDGTSLSIQANDKGRLYILASSPCVWPDGTPPPAAAAAPTSSASALMAESATEHIQPPPQPSAEPQRGPRRPEPYDDEDHSDLNFWR